MKKNRLKGFLIVSTILILVLFFITTLSSCTRSVTLYFASSGETDFYLVKEIREISVSGDLYKSVLEELIKGPDSSDLYPVIPSDVRVNSVKISGGTATVDFSKEIITNLEEIPHSSATEILAIFSIVDTLTEFEEIERVKITIEGKESGEIDGLYIEDFWGHVGIYEEFTRNEEIIRNSIEQ
ncbi:MAG: GerMN domain-containing protein [Actinomycetota bacterium]|nr:GerMN domain-containing protein [Actinomycetota bacterium]